MEIESDDGVSRDCISEERMLERKRRLTTTATATNAFGLALR